jgi:hypothetical protein
MDEMRETFAAIGRINAAENERAKLVRKGGAGAAKILIEEDRNATGRVQSEVAVMQDISRGRHRWCRPSRVFAQQSTPFRKEGGRVTPYHAYAT